MAAPTAVPPGGPNPYAPLITALKTHGGPGCLVQGPGSTVNGVPIHPAVLAAAPSVLWEDLPTCPAPERTANAVGAIFDSAADHFSAYQLAPQDAAVPSAPTMSAVQQNPAEPQRQGTTAVAQRAIVELDITALKKEDLALEDERNPPAVGRARNGLLVYKLPELPAAPVPPEDRASEELKCSTSDKVCRVLKLLVPTLAGIGLGIGIAFGIHGFDSGADGVQTAMIIAAGTLAGFAAGLLWVAQTDKNKAVTKLALQVLAAMPLLFFTAFTRGFLNNHHYHDGESIYTDHSGSANDWLALGAVFGAIGSAGMRFGFRKQFDALNGWSSLQRERAVNYPRAHAAFGRLPRLMATLGARKEQLQEGYQTRFYRYSDPKDGVYNQYRAALQCVQNYHGDHYGYEGTYLDKYKGGY